VRKLEQRLATTLGLAFWDWQGAMGGPCTTMAWVAQGCNAAIMSISRAKAGG
jgi:hypothetical protein